MQRRRRSTSVGLELTDQIGPLDQDYQYDLEWLKNNRMTGGGIPFDPSEGGDPNNWVLDDFPPQIISGTDIDEGGFLEQMSPSERVQYFLEHPESEHKPGYTPTEVKQDIPETKKIQPLPDIPGVPKVTKRTHRIAEKVAKRVVASEAMPEWLLSMSKMNQQAYFDEHPESRYAPQNRDKQPDVPGEDKPAPEQKKPQDFPSDGASGAGGGKGDWEGKNMDKLWTISDEIGKHMEKDMGVYPMPSEGGDGFGNYQVGTIGMDEVDTKEEAQAQADYLNENFSKEHIPNLESDWEVVSIGDKFDVRNKFNGKEDEPSNEGLERGDPGYEQDLDNGSQESGGLNGKDWDRHYDGPDSFLPENQTQQDIETLKSHEKELGGDQEVTNEMDSWLKTKWGNHEELGGAYGVKLDEWAEGKAEGSTTFITMANGKPAYVNTDEGAGPHGVPAGDSVMDSVLYRGQSFAEAVNSQLDSFAEWHLGGRKNPEYVTDSRGPAPPNGYGNPRDLPPPEDDSAGPQDLPREPGETPAGQPYKPSEDFPDFPDAK